MKQKKYRVAVLGRTGQGNYGHALDTSWLKLPNVELVSVADEDAAGRAKAADRLQVQQTFADCTEMLDAVRPDILTIAPRWIDRHHEWMMAAIERGIHVYVEKPFCRTLREADEIVQAAQMRHVRIAIAHPTRYSPTLQTVKRLIANGAIGDVLEILGNGKEDRRGGGEDMWVLGSHLFDMLLTLGYQPEWCHADITADGRAIGPADFVEGGEGIGVIAGDRINATYGIGNGLTARFRSHRNAGGNPSRYGLRIFGSKGLIDIFEGTLPEIYVLQEVDWAGRSGTNSWKKISTAGIDRPEPLTDPKFRDRHLLAMEDLLQSIEQQREPQCGAEAGRAITEMILAPYESARTGGVVRFPLQNREHPLQTWLKTEG